MKSRQALNLIHNKKFLLSMLKPLFIIILCIPLFFLNIRNDIDWGDDNAHYLLQAKYIAEGHPQSDQQYLFNQNCPVLGPPAYPAGFPLLLSAVYHFKGLNLHAFSLIMTFSLLVFCLMMYFYYKKTHRYFTIIFLILIIAYNPWTINFKSEIMSEIPFAGVLFLALILYKNNNKLFTLIIVSILAGFLMSVRTIGVVLPIAIALDRIILFIRLLRNKDSCLKTKKTIMLLQVLIFLIIAGGVYFILNRIIFSIPSDPAYGYAQIFSTHGLLKIITDNFAYYINIFELFFNPKNDSLMFLSLASRSVVFTMVIIGFARKVFTKPDISDYVVILYFIVLLIYPYKQSGFRFFLPMLPILLSYGIFGLKSIRLPFKMQKNAVILILGMLMMVQYYYGIEEINKTRLFKQEGPCSDEAWQAFDYIKKSTPPGSVISFVKPRALALFTDRKSVSNDIKNHDISSVSQTINTFKVDYILLYCKKENEENSFLLDEMLNPPMEKYIAGHKEKISPIWNNGRFKLYKTYN